jgi:hypothetical protein
MSVTLECTSAPFVRCGKKLKLSYGDAYGGVRRSVLCWCVWQESGFSRREDVFTFDLVHKGIL